MSNLIRQHEMRRLITLCETEDWGSAAAVFQGGDCGTFAYALHQRTGWQAMASENHVWLVNPDGKAVDINGVHETDMIRLPGDEGLTVHPHRISERDVQDRDNLAWANQIIANHPSRFGIAEW